MTNYDEIIDELRDALLVEDIDSIRDRAGEFTDNFVPVYTHDIIKEWAEMPSEYDDRGAIELGYEGDADIVRQMSLDLYIYYSELVGRAIDELEKEG